MKLFGKKKTKSSSSKILNINKVITLDDSSFLIDNLVFKDQEVRVNIFMDGDYFLLHEDDIDDTRNILVEYLGFHHHELWINGSSLYFKKKYNSSSQLRSSSENLDAFMRESNVVWSNIGRQTLVYKLDEKVKHFDSISLRKDTRTRMIEVKKIYKDLKFGIDLDIKVPYDASKNIIIRKLETREIKLHQQVVNQMVKRDHEDDKKILSAISKYQNLIAYVETPIDVEEIFISIQSKFDHPSYGFAGGHSYEQIPVIMSDSFVDHLELGLIPKAFEVVDIRIGYLKVEERTQQVIQLL